LGLGEIRGLFCLENIMLNITNSAGLARALDSPLDGAIKRLLIERRDQLAEYVEKDIAELAHWIVVDPGDSAEAIDTVAGFPIIADPSFEWVMNHGGLFELPTILSDDGFGVVLFVPDIDGIAPTLLTLCRERAEPNT
jgi:hypothetical protein